MVELRRKLHRIPELAFEEVRTARVLMAELDRLEIPYRYTGPGGGILARVDGGPGPVVALRAEMDALPGTETTGLPFASEVPGVVHACGHDAHMAMVIGAASLLRERPPPGGVVLVFQPAEERGGGARVMIRDGALDGVEAIFGGHVTQHYETGKVMVASGVITSQSDRFRIDIRGKAGHGARPHEAIDAVVVAAFLVNALQTLVSRDTDPVHPTVVTVGRVEAGSAANVIAGEALLEGTLRTTDPDTRARVHDGIARICRAVGELHNAVVEISLGEGYPAVVNTAREAATASRAVTRRLGPDALVAMDHPSLGSEDFSYYLQEVPGCYVRFGVRRPGSEYVPLHSPLFDVDEDSLSVGAAFFDAVARQAIEELRR